MQRPSTFLLSLLMLLAFGACAASPEAVARWEKEAADRQAALDAASTREAEQRKAEAKRNADLEFNRPTVNSFEEAWALDDAQFDLAQSCLLFARDYGGQDIDVEAYLKTIDEWTQEFHRLTKHLTKPEDRIEALGTYLTGNLGFRYDVADPKGHDPRNLYLNAVIDRKRGYCVSLSLLYLLIGQRAGLPLEATRLPGHFGLLHRDGTDSTYYEATDRVRKRSSHQLYSRFRMSMTAVEEHPAYLSALSSRTIFSTVFSNRGALAMLEGKPDEAKQWFERAVQVDQHNLEARFNRAAMQSQSGKVADVQDAMAELNAILEIDGNFYPAWCWRANLLDQSGRTPEAMQNLSRAKGIWPERSMAYVIEGLIHYRAENFVLSRQNLEIALKKEPNDSDARRNYEIVLEALGDHDALTKFRASQAAPSGSGR